MTNIMLKIKDYIKIKIQNIIGTNELKENIRILMTHNIINNLNTLNEHKEEILLSMFPTAKGGVKVTHNFENIKKYLSLIRPIETQMLNLKRIGGKNDGGYIMSNPPPTTRITRC